jgi:predicted hotdog family 3-hydroxylacyl-ACP dehydratase
MKTSREGRQGALGVTEVARNFERLGWGTIFNSRHDYGTDLFMLVIDQAGDDRGLLVGAQVKAGPSFFKETKTTDDGEVLGWWFRDRKRSHVDSWAEHAVPHLIVLHDLDTEESYWAHVTPESIVSTGKGAKVFVPRDNLVDDANRERLERVAAGTTGRAGWEESAWTGKSPPTTADGLRYAMMVPRLVAPHPNAGDGDGLTPEQGLALLVQVRIRDYQRFAAAHTKVPSLDRAARSRSWRWRLVGAFGKWLLEEDSGDLVDLIDSAPDSAARSAATVASACALLEQGQINAAITAIEKALAAAGNRSVDEAWLRIQHARCCAELGRLVEARDAALAVQSIRPDAARDVTAAALLGAAATLIFNTSGWGAKNLDEVITVGDTAAVWWRSQVTRWGLDGLAERDFKDWSRDTSITVGAVDKVAKEFESGALLASHSADQGGWRHLRALRGQSELLQLDRTADPEHAYLGLRQLLQAGDTASLKLAVRHLIADGPATAVTQLGADLRLGEATRTTALAELTVIEQGGSMLDTKAADRVVRWILATLGDPTPYAQRISASFVVNWQLLDSLAGVITAAGLRAQRQVIRHIIDMPPEPEQVFATAWRRVLKKLPNRAWTEELALQAKPRPREHHLTLRIGLLGIAARYDAGARRSLQERARRGSLDALSCLGNVTDLPPRVSHALIEQMARQVEKQIADAHKGTFGMGTHDVPEVLVLLNAWHPQQAQWRPILAQLSDPVVAIESKQRALVVLANLADRLPEQVREELRPIAAALCREEIGGRVNPFEPDDDLVGRATHLAIVLRAIDPSEDEAPLVRLLQGDEEHRRWAAFLAARLRRPTDVGLLVTLTSDPHPMVRASAAGGLAGMLVDELGGELVPATLRSCLGDGGAWVPDAIAGVLGERSEPSGDGDVAKELLAKLREHPSAVVRASARGET